MRAAKTGWLREMVLTVSPGNGCWRHRSTNRQNTNERPTRVLHKPDKLISYRHFRTRSSAGVSHAAVLVNQITILSVAPPSLSDHNKWGNYPTIRFCTGFSVEEQDNHGR